MSACGKHGQEVDGGARVGCSSHKRLFILFDVIIVLNYFEKLEII